MSEIHYLGTASNIKQETTIAVSGTWATNDTATITINGNDVTVTVGSDVATTDIVDILVKAINASDNTDLVNDESRNIGGQQIPEFTEVVAVDSGSTLTLRSVTAGIPFTVTASETTAGTGALGTPTEAIAATGAEWWNNADNWSGGAVPVNSDEAVLDERAAAGVKYGLDQSAVTLAKLTITKGFNRPKTVGLPSTVSTGAGTYAEYRETRLKISATTVSIGEGDGNQMSDAIKLDLGSIQATVNVVSTGTSQNGIPAVILLGTNASNALYVTAGSVSTAFYDGDSATFATVRSSGDLFLADGTTLTNVDITGGTAEIYAATTTLECFAGKTYVNEAAHASIDCYEKSEVYYKSNGTLTALEISGKFDTSLDNRSRTITDQVVINRGGTLNDPYGTLTLTGGFTVRHGNIQAAKINLGNGRAYTVT